MVSNLESSCCPFTRTPWVRGCKEVMIDVSDGQVMPRGTRVLRNKAPSEANLSSAGDVLRSYPYAPKWSARRVSTVMSRMLSGVLVGSVVARQAREKAAMSAPKAPRRRRCVG